MFSSLWTCISVWPVEKHAEKEVRPFFINQSMNDLVVVMIFYIHIVFYAPLSHKTSVSEPQTYYEIWILNCLLNLLMAKLYDYLHFSLLWKQLNVTRFLVACWDTKWPLKCMCLGYKAEHWTYIHFIFVRNKGSCSGPWMERLYHILTLCVAVPLKSL